MQYVPDHEDTGKGLSRVEFLGLLVHLAIQRFVRTAEIPSVAQAVRRLLGEMRSAVPPSMCVDADGFRSAHCYTEEVNKELLRHEASLRALFTVLSASDGLVGNAAKMRNRRERWNPHAAITALSQPEEATASCVPIPVAAFAPVSCAAAPNARNSQSLSTSGLKWHGP